MKIISKGKGQRYATLVLALGISLAANSGIVIAADKPSAGALSVAADVNSHESTAGVNRIDLANQILNRWQPIAEAVGQNAVTWREIFSTQFGLMDASILSRVAAVQPDAGSAAANYALFTQAIRNAGAQAHHLAQSGNGQLKLGSASSDLVYIPIVPCRLVDTRNVGGPISFGTARNFSYYTNSAAFNFGTFQGGTPGAAGTVCPGTFFPDNAPQLAAAAITLTVVSPSAAGNLVAWGGASPIPNTSALNWTGPGEILANTTIIPAGGRSGSGPGGSVLDFALFYNGPSGSAQFTADVVGYFVENVATALDCIQLNASAPIGAGANGFVSYPACTTGYTRTGGFCVGLQGTTLFDTGPVACGILNPTGTAISVTAATICCRIPGR